MAKFSANLSMLFTEVPFLERFALASKAGFQAVEFLFPYEHPVEDIKRCLDVNNLQLVLHNLPAGNWDDGERGLACHPERIAEFRDGVKLAIEYALALEVEQLNCLVGKTLPQIADEAMRTTLVENLKYAAAAMRDANLRLLIEPINTFDIPGFYINTTRQAFCLLDEVNADNIFLQYDIYHAQRMEGDLVRTLERHLHRIGHIQLADNPGRHEPGTGEINFDFLLPYIDRMGYKGWIGCEYRPLRRTEDGLGGLMRFK